MQGVETADMRIDERRQLDGMGTKHLCNMCGVIRMNRWMNDKLSHLVSVTENMSYSYKALK